MIRNLRHPLTYFALRAAALGCFLLVFALGAGFAAAAREMPFGTGVLWTVERAGAAPSYVFGTLHLTDEWVTTLPAPVARAAASVDSLTVEVVRTPDQQAKSIRKMMLTDGRRLDGILGPGLFARAAAIAGRYGLPKEGLKRLKPWAVLVTISVPPAELKRLASGKLPLDLILIKRARARGIPVHALETIGEQLDLFDGLALDDQVTMLRQAVEDNGRIAEYTAKITRYYLARDLQGLLDWMEKMAAGNDPRMREIFWTRLVDARNRVMVTRMQPRLAEGNAFVAVGAAHLPGEKGILNLLAEQGYTVRKLY